MIFGATRLWIAPQFSGKLEISLVQNSPLASIMASKMKQELGAIQQFEGIQHEQQIDPFYYYTHRKKRTSIYIYIVWVNTLAPGNTTAIASWNQKSTGFVTRISRPPDFWALQNPSKSHGTRSPIINSHQTLHLWYHIISYHNYHIYIYNHIYICVCVCMIMYVCTFRSISGFALPFMIHNNQALL